MIDTFIEDEERKNELYRAMETIPCVERKASWALNGLKISKTTQIWHESYLPLGS